MIRGVIFQDLLQINRINLIPSEKHSNFMGITKDFIKSKLFVNFNIQRDLSYSAFMKDSNNESHYTDTIAITRKFVM